jgi:hypothetical protein
MQTQIKRYNLLLRGKVQHIGYRGIIEGAARKLDMKGNDIKEFARSDIESIEKKEIHEELYLPSVFSRVATDEYYEFSKKFDIGIDLLDGIKTDTGEMKGTLNKINETLGDFVTEQQAHNQRLEKILEKLAER